MNRNIEGLLVHLRSGGFVRLSVPDYESFQDVVALLDAACEEGGNIQGFKLNGDYVVVPGRAINHMEIVLTGQGNA